MTGIAYVSLAAVQAADDLRWALRRIRRSRGGRMALRRVAGVLALMLAMGAMVALDVMA